MQLAQQRNQQVTAETIVEGFTHHPIVGKGLKGCIERHAVACVDTGGEHLLRRRRANVDTQIVNVFSFQIPIQQSRYFFPVTRGDAHRLKGTGHHAHVADGQDINGPFARDATHHKTDFIHMGADHHLRAPALVDADKHGTQPIKLNLFMVLLRLTEQDVAHLLL